MSNFFTLLIEATALFSTVYFSIAFVAGFIRYEQSQPTQQPEQTAMLDTVVPFARPYRKPACEPINWSLWGVRDLRTASQRSPFGIPARDESGKMFNKAALCDMYTVAMANAFGSNTYWQSEELEAA